MASSRIKASPLRLAAIPGGFGTFTLENMRPPGALVNESVTELYIPATLS